MCAKPSPFYHFFLQIVETSSGRMWKLRAGGLLYARTAILPLFIKIVETSIDGMSKLAPGGLLFAMTLPFYHFFYSDRGDV